MCEDVSYILLNTYRYSNIGYTCIFVKLFKTNNLETVTYTTVCSFDMPSTILKRVMLLLENIGYAVTFLYTGS